MFCGAGVARKDVGETGVEDRLGPTSDKVEAFARKVATPSSVKTVVSGFRHGP